MNSKHVHNFNIILVSAKVGRGKDLISDYINMRYDFRKYAYADELKRILTNAGWDGNKDEKGRKLLQNVGLSFRNYNIDFWVKKLAHKIVSESVCDFDNTNIVISDARHVNEIEELPRLIEKEYGNNFVNNLIRIRIEGINYSDRYTDSQIDNDVSEKNLDNYSFDYIIDNTNKTKEEMFKEVDKIMDKYGFKPFRPPMMC